MRGHVATLPACSNQPSPEGRGCERSERVRGSAPVRAAWGWRASVRRFPSPAALPRGTLSRRERECLAKGAP